MGQFKALTSLRLLLALWVVCRHWFHMYGVDEPYFDIGFTSTFFDHGYLGVDGFFILSGFILTYNYAPASGPPNLDWRKFIVARIARIYPAYIACLLIFAAAVIVRDMVLHTDALGSPDYTLSSFVVAVFLVSAWRYAGPAGWNDVGWSVSAEWFAYVMFPLFLLVAPRHSKSRILLLAGFALAVLALVEATSAEHLSLSGGVARLIPEFLLGVLICRLRQALPEYHGFALGAVLSLIVCAVGVGLNLDTLFVAGAAGLIFSLSYEKDVLTRVLSVGVLVFLGEVSYCIYIVQRIPQYLFTFARRNLPDLAAMPGPVQALLLLVLTVGAAILLHYLIEKPMRVWINRRFGPRRGEVDPIAPGQVPKSVLSMLDAQSHQRGSARRTQQALLGLPRKSASAEPRDGATGS
ncbi:acyltransferase [Cupriavidus sp. TA19]|uniref:acyltransferase family protein n=1 Tax=unclassified Cupriavidus TaxID=2640874 RepID=UPI0027294CF0|nr:acyltransferase [Cupriavidus sp. TA19]GLC92249.1 acyltransferase [Cupriavidus sp. TA19]